MPSIDRRHFLVAAGLGLAGSVGAQRAWETAALEPAVPTGDWHHPRHDAGNTAATTDPGPGTAGERGWRTRVSNTGVGDGLAMWNGTLLAPFDGRLLGFDPTTGDRSWTLTPDDERRSLDSSPRVRGSTAYLAAGSVYVYAVSLETRRPRWRYRTNGSIRTMTLAGNTLCFSSFDDDGEMTIALDTETGRTRWRRSEWWYAAGARGDLIVAVQRRDPDDLQRGLELVAIDLETGTTEWTQPLEDVSLSIGSSVVCLADRVLVTGHHGTAVLERASGEVVRTLEGATAAGDVAVDADADRLYATDPRNGIVTGVSLADDDAWTVDAPVADGIAVGGDTVYAATGDGLLALEAATGAERFAVSFDASASRAEVATPLVAGDAVYHRRGNSVYQVRTA